MKDESHNNKISELMSLVLKSINQLDKEIESHFGISSAKVLTLLAFTERKIMKMNELSEVMSLSTSTMTRMVDNLVKDDLIERGQDQFDRRLVIVRLTNKGKKIAKEIKEFKEKYFDSINEIVEKDGKEEMISSLKILIDAFENFKSKL